jgi:heme oxygenase
VKSGVGELLSDWAARSRSAALLNDLCDLDATCEPSQLSRGSLTLSEQLGALYVLEGSRLGGQVLLRRAQGSEDERVRFNTRYLQSNDANLWRSFLGTLESMPETNAQQMIGAARFAFDLFSRAFELTRSRN